MRARPPAVGRGWARPTQTLRKINLGAGVPGGSVVIVSNVRRIAGSYLTQSPPEEGSNKRAAQRQRALLGAKLVFGNGAYTPSCTIRDISRGSGARVKIPSADLISNDVYLIDIKKGVAYEARIVWRTPAECGLKFGTRYDLNDPPREFAYLRRIWMECVGR